MAKEAQVELDHLAYLTQRRHRRLVHGALRKTMVAANPARMLVVHDGRGTCCRIEPWATTSARLMAALLDDGVRLAWAVPDAAGVALMLPGERS